MGEGAGAGLTAAGARRAIWNSWTWVADAGTHVDTPEGMVRVVAFMLTLGGMLVFALLVGIVADEISNRVDELKKGRTRVLEKNHIVVLNWSNKMLPLLRELAMANESAGGVCIAVLSARPKEEMEDEIQGADLDLLGSRVVCRSGDPAVTSDLAQVSPQRARAVVILSNAEMDPDDADAKSLRAVLSLNLLLSLGPKKRAGARPSGLSFLLRRLPAPSWLSSPLPHRRAMLGRPQTWPAAARTTSSNCATWTTPTLSRLSRRAAPRSSSRTTSLAVS